MNTPLEKMHPVTLLKYGAKTGIVSFNQPKGGARHGIMLLVTKNPVLIQGKEKEITIIGKKVPEVSINPFSIRLIKFDWNIETPFPEGIYYLHAITIGGGIVGGGTTNSDPVTIKITVTTDVANMFELRKLSSHIDNITKRLDNTPSIADVKSEVANTTKAQCDALFARIEKIVDASAVSSTTETKKIADELIDKINKLDQEVQDRLTKAQEQKPEARVDTPVPATSVHNQSAKKSGLKKCLSWLLWALIGSLALWLLALCFNGKNNGCVYGVFIGNSGDITANNIRMPDPQVVCYTNVEIVAAPVQQSPTVCEQKNTQSPVDNRVAVPVGPTTRQVVVQRQVTVPVMVENYSWGWGVGYNWDGPSHRRVRNVTVNNYRCDVPRQNCPPGYGHPVGWTTNPDGSPDCGPSQQHQQQRMHPPLQGGGHGGARNRR